MPLNPKDKIIQHLKAKKIASFAELSRLGASGTLLKRLKDAGEISALSTGIYASIEIDPFTASIWATSKYFPEAVISGLTALHIHGLSEEYVEKIDVDIPRTSSLKNKLLQVHRVPEARIVGITSHLFQNRKIRIYDIERTLCDAYRIDPSGPLFFKALKRYIAKGEVKIDLIQKYDQATKTKVLTHLRQELADA
jgi:predicted transcriptional regulator of viral defense system